MSLVEGFHMKTFLSIVMIFVIGLVAGLFVANAQSSDFGPDGDYDLSVQSTSSAFGGVTPRESPMDRVPEKAIEVYSNRIILDIKDAEWATFTDTHSMEPVLSKGANALEIRPKSEADIKVGDIVSYRSDYAEGYIIHRVVYQGEDELGTYYIMKGDNLPTSDPGRVRFEQMERVVIGIIY
jgi:hypothetical protein